MVGSTDSPGKTPYYDYCNYLLSPCDDGAYAKVTWNGYMTVVDDAFAADPVLQTATVDPASRPLFTGGCSADGACKADLDFNTSLDAEFVTRARRTRPPTTTIAATMPIRP